MFKIFVCIMFVLEIFRFLTRVQLRNTYMLKIYFVCLIFVLFDEYENFFTTSISRITVSCSSTVHFVHMSGQNGTHCNVSLLGCNEFSSIVSSSEGKVAQAIFFL